MNKIKMKKVGNSYAVFIPKETADRIGPESELTFINTPDGFKISLYDEEFEQQMEVADKYAKKYRNALRMLADK